MSKIVCVVGPSGSKSITDDDRLESVESDTDYDSSHESAAKNLEKIFKKKKDDRSTVSATDKKKAYKFCNAWLKHPDFQDWLSESTRTSKNKNSSATAFCKVCSMNMLAHKTVIKKHAISARHKFNLQQISNNIRIPEMYRSSDIEKNIQIAEIKLCSLLVQQNLPFALMDTLEPLLKNIFYDSKIANDLALERTKATSVVCECLGKTFMDKLYKKLQQPGVFFSLIMDETTDISVKKQCAFTVIYFDSDENNVVTQFLDIIETEGCTANDLFSSMMNMLENNQISFYNLVGFSSDTTNVMAGQYHSVFTLLKEKIPHIVCVKCSCHMAHLAISKACLKLPRSVENLLRNLGSHFNRSSSRRQEYKKFQTFFQTEIHKILSPALTRWLSLKGCVDRVLEQYFPLEAYLRENVFEDPSITTEQMLSTMQNKFTVIYLEFMSYTLGLMTEFNLLFQSEKPLLYRVKPETQKLLTTLCSNFIQISFIRNQDIFKLDHQNPRYFVSIENIYIGISATESFNNLKSNREVESTECERFLKTILEFYVELVSNIKQKFKFEDPIYDILTIVEPHIAQSFSHKSLNFIIERFPILKEHITSPQILDNEWRQHALLDFENLKASSNPETYWRQIFDMKNSANVKIFPNLNRVINFLLILPFSNASVERVFSHLFNIKTDKRNLLSTTTLKSILVSKDAIESSGGCVKFVPDERMLNFNIRRNKN